jgi:nitroimidazol reductase NimA-like FMN-containing flavoprotein (pyridoxamine 5'-phosphate oxidase superfamily)
MKPRELSHEECSALLSRGRYGRLGLSQNDMPYVIPISYVYSKGIIYLHSRGKGRKVEIAAKNPNVCFEVDLLDKDCWSSVVVSGRASLSSDLEAKARMFGAFTGKEMGGHGGAQFKREDLEKMEMTIWEIEIKDMTGREGIW